MSGALRPDLSASYACWAADTPRIWAAAGIHPGRHCSLQGTRTFHIYWQAPAAATDLRLLGKETLALLELRIPRGDVLRFFQ